MTLLTNPKLSICIPTYNRADYLDYSLGVHLPKLKEHNIQIFIYDNASNDTTFDVVSKWKKEYPLINYHRNNINLGADLNIELALKAPTTDYIWLMGDTYLIPDNGLSHILDLAQQQIAYDAIVVNLFNKLAFPTGNYSDHDQLLGDLGALMSCLSCLIFHKDLISNADFPRYRNTNFIQTGIIFEYLSRKEFTVHWAREISIASLNNPNLKKSSWASSKKIFDIGITSWTNFIFSLPAKYSLEKKLATCVGFGQVSQAFTIKGMLILRAQGTLDYEIYCKFKDIFKLSLPYPTLLVLALTIIPKGLLKLAISAKKKFKIQHETESHHEKNT